MTNETTRTPAIDATTNVDALTVTLAFSNGQTLSIDATALNGDIQAMATLHGLKQKLVDAAAISRNPDTGRSATIDDKYNAVKEVYDRLLAGQWNKNREGGSVRGGLLFRALCILYADKTPEAVRAFLEKKTPKEKTALRELPKVAAIIATIRADETDSANGIDGEALLGELDD
jgi:hypothetical protein